MDMIAPMPQTVVATGRLPPNWAAFAEAVAAGDTPEAAAKSLGFAEPKRTAALLMRAPEVRKALVEATKAFLEGEASILAMDVVREILEDRDPKAKAVRAKMAVAILDRSAPAKAPASPGSKPLHELTVEELMAEASRLRTLPPGPQMRDITPGREGPSGT
jgi:hypothetical protein